MGKKLETAPTNKVNKVNVDVVKVTMGSVKPPVTFVKRRLHKFLVSNKLNAKTSTATKPESIKLSEEQVKTVETSIKSFVKEMVTVYTHLGTPQVTYIRNHINTHQSRYIK